mgnify:CR=1 FL=1
MPSIVVDNLRMTELAGEACPDVRRQLQSQLLDTVKIGAGTDVRPLDGVLAQAEGLYQEIQALFRTHIGAGEDSAYAVSGLDRTPCRRRDSQTR